VGRGGAAEVEHVVVRGLDLLGALDVSGVDMVTLVLAADRQASQIVSCAWNQIAAESSYQNLQNTHSTITTKHTIHLPAWDFQ
jgi:hypothetical protein